MQKLLKGFSILLFLVSPFAAVAGVWFSDWRYLWITLILFIFSAFTNGVAEAYKPKTAKAKMIAVAAQNASDELIDFDDSTWEWIAKYGEKNDKK